MEYLNDGPLARLWEHAVFNNGLTPDAVSQIDINGAIDALKTTRNLPLPVAGELLHAVSRVLDSSAEFALEDAKETNRELYKTFKDQISVNDGGEVDHGASIAEPPMETGLELGNITLPDSLIGRRHQHAPEDISIDAIVREDRSMDRSLDDKNVLEEVPQRSAEELAALEALDLGGYDDAGMDAGMDADAGDMFDFPTMPESEQGLDFGSDLQHSSSPPHTPRAENEIDVVIQNSSSPHAPAQEAPRKRAPRRHGAPVDDVISVVRPTKPSAQILRPPITIAQRDEHYQAEEDSVDFIPLDDATERLVDPAYVQAEMKRRRLGGDFSAGSDLSFSMEDRPNFAEVPEAEDDAGIDFEADWDMDMGGIEGDSDRPSHIASDSESQSTDEGDEQDDTAEALKEGAAAAKAVLLSHLRRKGTVVHFDDIATSAQTRADTLMEVLNLAAKGRVRPHQDGAWGPITITQL